jgi:hypothetical protein
MMLSSWLAGVAAQLTRSICRSARGGGMDRLGQRFLADAAFALQQHRHAGARGLGGDGQRGAEFGRVADDIVKGEQRGDFLGQRAKLAAGLRGDRRLPAPSRRSGPAA